MPDLDRELATLRDTLEESVRLPELDSVVTRHRQRTTRRRTQLAAAAAVLVVAAVIPVLRVQPEPEPIAEPPATGTGAPGSVAPQVDDVQFADEKTGYALRRVCDITKCDIDLLVTEDAQRWHPRDLPLVDRNEGTGNSMRLYVFAPGRIAVAVRGASSLPRWYSDDGGKTWRRVPDELAPTVEAIPDGAVLRSRCIGDVCRHIAGVEVVLPDSGRSALLATQPPLNEPRPGDIPAGDGAWWVSGKDRTTGRSALALSRDAGRTWTVAVLQAPTLPELTIVSVSASRDTMYATAIGEFSRTELGLLAIFASTDGGRTWSQTWYGTTDKEPRVVNGVAIAKEKGSLMVVTEEGVHQSNDYGKTFELAKTHLGPVRWTRIGYLVRNPRTDNEYIRFADNPTWTEITVG